MLDKKTATQSVTRSDLRLPAPYTQVEYVDAGGLMFYGVSLSICRTAQQRL